MPRSRQMGLALTPDMEQAYRDGVQKTLTDLLAIPGLRDVVMTTARREFLKEYGAPVSLGALALIGLGYAIGRASK